MQGMHRAGMATTGKHFPGHGSVEADSHIAAPVDSRSLAEIEAQDMQPFKQLQADLDALMPAHVIYDQIDPNPAGFSEFWIQNIIRKQLGFDGVLFSDDLSMQAACVAGGADARIKAALNAGCDMGLVCNDRAAAIDALNALADLPLPNQARLERMRGKLGTQTISSPLVLDEVWAETQAQIQKLLPN
jgi:beta-N-acetylhexosaminidase